MAVELAAGREAYGGGQRREREAVDVQDAAPESKSAVQPGLHRRRPSPQARHRQRNGVAAVGWDEHQRETTRKDRGPHHGGEVIGSSGVTLQVCEGRLGRLISRIRGSPAAIDISRSNTSSEPPLLTGPARRTYAEAPS